MLTFNTYIKMLAISSSLSRCPSFVLRLVEADTWSSSGSLTSVSLFHTNVIRHSKGKINHGSLQIRVQQLTSRPGQAEKLGLKEPNCGLHNYSDSLQGLIIAVLKLSVGLSDQSHRPCELSIAFINNQ